MPQWHSAASNQLMAVKTLVIEGEGTQYNLGQDVVPGASGQTFAVTSYRRVDRRGGERACERSSSRFRNLRSGRGSRHSGRFRELTGAIAYNVAASGAASPRRASGCGRSPRRIVASPCDGGARGA